jgi:Peptidase MA superfamily
VLAPASAMTLGIALGEQADRPATWPGLGRREPGPLRLVVAPDQAALQRLGRGQIPTWGVGLALPGARTIVVRADASDPYGALRHELAHLALHDAVRVRVPLWFDEGYAVMAAGEWDRIDALRLNLAVVGGKVSDLRALDAALRQSEMEAATGYALAGSTVQLLARLNPTGTLDPLLARLAAGASFDSAVVVTTGLTLSGFERAWQKDLRRRFGWFVWLAAGGGWSVVAVVVLAAARWRRRRDRPRRAALDIGWEIPEDVEDSESTESVQSSRSSN